MGGQAVSITRGYSGFVTHYHFSLESISGLFGLYSYDVGGQEGEKKLYILLGQGYHLS